MVARGDDLPPHSQVLIAQINDCYEQAWEHLKARKVDAAKEQYLALVDLYQKLSTHKINDVHKHMAGYCVREIYDELKFQIEGPPVSPRSFVTMVVATILVLVFGGALYLNPSLSGLVTFDAGPPVWDGEKMITISGPTDLDMRKYFNLGFGGELGVLATRSDAVDVRVAHTMVTLIPTAGFHGETSITVIGFNAEQNPPPFTKILLTVRVT